ncbi:hypothetical protein FHS43_002215 [Streptosporangium becharense]|uniref:Uncharacterized protein n=1 Tax=Streptosporangium becharense TaxID=1816182 RepID=A0A7W9IKJ6_9ACTN|nr:hypothetical protein [Streptosporangium becharense]MBB2910950.1 hypothetical protein [Streptosporangium becharense]MBB5821991.1 hypothetical protein [Streptosporangium becharense]
MNDDREPGSPSRFGDEEEEHGYSPDVGRSSEEVTQAGDRAFQPPPDDKGAGRVVSDEERAGVSSADTEPASAHGVGPSESRSGERIAATEGEDRETAGTEGADRPYGVSEPGDSTGVGSPKTVDEESPQMPAGDQGG